MAGSRVYKIGTVFSRAEALIKSKAVQEEARPLWFDIYQKFPPKFPPEFGRSAPDIEVKQIFYEEDILRARIKKEYPKAITASDLTSKKPTSSQKCVNLYRTLVAEGKSSKEAMDEAFKRMFVRFERN